MEKTNYTSDDIESLDIRDSKDEFRTIKIEEIEYVKILYKYSEYGFSPILIRLKDLSLIKTFSYEIKLKGHEHSIIEFQLRAL